MTTIAGVPVFDFVPDFDGEITMKNVTIQDMIKGFGLRQDAYPDFKPQRGLNFDYSANSQVEALQIENFFENARGRLDSFWLPSWRSQIVTRGGLTAGATQIMIPACNFATAFPTGSVIFFYDFVHAPEFKTVTGTTTTGGFDTITFSALSRTYTGRRFMVGVCYLVRFANDQLSATWSSPDFAKYKIGFTETVNWRADAEPVPTAIPGWGAPTVQDDEWVVVCGNMGSYQIKAASSTPITGYAYTPTDGTPAFGFSFDPTTGTFTQDATLTYQPPAATYHFLISATNGFGTGSAKLTFIIAPCLTINFSQLNTIGSPPPNLMMALDGGDFEPVVLDQTYTFFERVQLQLQQTFQMADAPGYGVYAICYGSIQCLGAANALKVGSTINGSQIFTATGYGADLQMAYQPNPGTSAKLYFSNISTSSPNNGTDTVGVLDGDIPMPSYSSGIVQIEPEIASVHGALNMTVNCTMDLQFNPITPV